ncbi:unnamed protein product [Cercopithifilaria johnstoni]|uniref:Secreted protein n=1 Tax=Cercopithifilaria johnstoni TaxID=2874296 RepID=A0A8J2PYF3_9BILA|nr:unnamed protein product [Cercopithifilaria johnstoni]
MYAGGAYLYPSVSLCLSIFCCVGCSPTPVTCRWHARQVDDVDRAGGEPRNWGLLLRRLRTDTSRGTDRQAVGETDIEYVCERYICVLGRVSISPVVLCRSELDALECNASSTFYDQ